MSSRSVVIDGIEFTYLIADDPGTDATCLEFYDPRSERGHSLVLAACQVGDPGSSDAYVYMGENVTLELRIVEQLLAYARERLNIPDPDALFRE